MWASQRIAVLQADLAGAEAELKVPSSDRSVLVAVVLVVIVAEVPFSSEGRREEEGKEGRKESFLVTSFACLPNRRRHRIWTTRSLWNIVPILRVLKTPWPRTSGSGRRFESRRDEPFSPRHSNLIFANSTSPQSFDHPSISLFVAASSSSRQAMQLGAVNQERKGMARDVQEHKRLKVPQIPERVAQSEA